MTALLNQKTQANSGDSISVSPGWYALAVLSLLMGFASISIDLYLPAVPAMSRSLHADAGMVEFTISGYLIGFSLWQLLWGPISRSVWPPYIRGHRPGPVRDIGTVIAAFSAMITALATGTGWCGLWGLVVPLFIFASTTGLIVANSITGALSDFPERAGTVSALIGAIQYGSGIVGSGLVGAFADGTPWPMGWVIGVAGIGSLLSMRLLTAVRSSKTGNFRQRKD
jgi:MFS family permease